MQRLLPPMALTDIDPPREPRSIAVDQARALLQQAVSDCDYTLDALEAAMGKGRAFIHKVLIGDKPLSFAFIVAMPADVRARFHTLSAESLGLIVVQPVAGDAAIRALIAGVVGVLQLQLQKAAA